MSAGNASINVLVELNDSAVAPSIRLIFTALRAVPAKLYGPAAPDNITDSDSVPLTSVVSTMR